MDNSIKLSLQQKQTLQLKMTPEMQLAIKMLQLNTLELKNQINELLESNPLVELDDSASKVNNNSDLIEVPLETLQDEPVVESPPLSKQFKSNDRNDFGIDWQKYIEDNEATEYKVSALNYIDDEEEFKFENLVSKKVTLREHLEKQLHEFDLSPTEIKIGEFIIGLIDNNGYLRYTKDQIAEMLKVSPEIVEKVIKTIQLMDPVGVGAYDLKECLLLQAIEDGHENNIVVEIIKKHLEDLASGKIQHIAKATGYDVDEVQAAIEIIKSYNPKPGAAFPSSNEQIYVIPDVFIEKEGDEYVVRLNERDIPRLRISNLYKEAIRNKNFTDKATYEFIRKKLEDARSFMRYLDKRKETILNVTKAIVSVQRDFFEHGILHLKPLTLQDIANITGVHESTVSRATSGKYAQTPRGLLELKFFFTGGTKTSGGSDLSVYAIKKRIEEVVKNEDPSNPLSDAKIAEILKSEGINIARRTVAKYRSELNIPSTSNRKILAKIK